MLREGRYGGFNYGVLMEDKTEGCSRGFDGVEKLAMKEGFEPSKRYKRLHTFQACAFSHSATSPFFERLIIADSIDNVTV